MEKSSSRLALPGGKCSRPLSSSPPCKKLRSGLSPLDDHSLLSRRKTFGCASKSSARPSSPAADASDVDRNLLQSDQENIFLSTSSSTRPRLPSISYLTPKKSESAEKSDLLESPLRRHLQSVGIESLHPNLVKLGKGTFGTVVLGHWMGKRVAVKVIGGEGSRQCKLKRRDSIECELNATKLSHPNIVKIFTTLKGETDDDFSTVVMEYVGQSSLQNVIEEYPHVLTLPFMHSVLCQIASALAHCHERNVIHLDVKPSNILVSSRGVCKLADFGCSIDLYKLKIEQHAPLARKRSFVAGTPGFMAPELMRNVRPTTKCDVFSFGILMWQVLAKQRLPFPGIHMHTIMFKVVSESFRPDESSMSDVPKILKELYASCWSQKVESRPSMSHVTKILNQFKVGTLEPKKKRPSLRPLR